MEKALPDAYQGSVRAISADLSPRPATHRARLFLRHRHEYGHFGGTISRGLGGWHRSIGAQTGKTSADGAAQLPPVARRSRTFWYCLAEAGIRLHSHWLLYPNPWPKASQFKKRLHGHGAFPKLAQLGGALEMRTNWDLFAEEFALAADLIGLKGSIDMVSPAAPMTLFERKYQERGQTLWRFSGEFSN